MNLRRQKLQNWIALQASAAVAAAGNRDHPISDMSVWGLREPNSGRSYTVVRVRTRTGLTGYGEAPAPVQARDVEKARALLTGKPASAYQVLRTETSLDGGINMALLDIAAKACSTPVYRLLAGPTRVKARAMAALTGSSDSELASSLEQQRRDGFKAFQVPLPSFTGRNQGQAFDKAVRARMDALRSAGGDDVDFVLDGAGKLTAGDAGSISASLERFHLLWFNEPCSVSNLQTIRKISDETVTPLGFGRSIEHPGVFQDLLRQGSVDILRPDISRYGPSRVRQLAIMAETYYVAVAPNHEGGPIATAAAVHLAASLPNFFIQHVPRPASEQDRQVRSEIVSQPVEVVKDGFLQLPGGSGFGIEVNESALNKYKEVSA